MNIQTNRQATKLRGAYTGLHQRFTQIICGFWGEVKPETGESLDKRRAYIQAVFNDLETKVGDVCEAIIVPDDVMGFDFLMAAVALAGAIDRAQRALSAFDQSMERELAAAMRRDPTITYAEVKILRLTAMQPLRALSIDIAGQLNDLVHQAAAPRNFYGRRTPCPPSTVPGGS